MAKVRAGSGGRNRGSSWDTQQSTNKQVAIVAKAAVVVTAAATAAVATAAMAATAATAAKQKAASAMGVCDI